MGSLRRLLIVALLAAATCAPAPALAQRTHTVRAGQSLSLIARRYSVSVWNLALANHMRPDQTLRPGDVLTIPPQGVTYVRPGQTLSEIAREHDCTVEDLRRLNRSLRNGALRAGQRLVLPGYQEPEESARPRDWGTPAQPGVARIRRHDAVTTVRLVEADGRVTREGLETLALLMRRHESDPPELPHPRLVRLIAAISDHFGGREIVLVSGRREAGGYTRETSRHVSGQATDIRVVGVPHRALWDYCRSLPSTGCGLYPRSTFVHVDVRERAAQWVDWSRPGARPSYGNLRRPFPRACRRRGAPRTGRCAREGRRVTREADLPLEVELTDEARAIMPVVPGLAPGEAPEEGEDAPGES
ncbi:MAG TPA: LysM peptidoglycan-binding domain-containing protein [Sandaracinaceae bacterium]